MSITVGVIRGPLLYTVTTTVVTFIACTVVGADSPDSKEVIRKLILELASGDFAVRQRATSELEQQGAASIAALMAAANSNDAEVRGRVRGILLTQSVSRRMDVRQAARDALQELMSAARPTIAKAAAETLRQAQEATAGAAASELTRLGATIGPAQAGQSLVFNVQVRQTWTGGDDRLSLLSELGEVPWLSLENSPITDAGLVHVARLGSSANGLTRLYLGSSRITGAGLSSLAPLSRLQYLSLKQLPIDDATLASLPDFPELQYLGLDGSRVGDTGLKTLVRYPQLQVLWLDYTPVTDAGLAHLGALTNLRTLYLPGIQLSGTGLAHLRQLPNLTSISLKGARLTAAGMKNVGQLEQLESLGLDMTTVTDDQLAELSGLSRLRILWLSGTQIGDAGLEHLKPLKALQIVHLSDTQVTREGAAELQRALPTCQITAVNQFRSASPERRNQPLPASPPLPTSP
jgi:hypothetical protein